MEKGGVPKWTRTGFRWLLWRTRFGQQIGKFSFPKYLTGFVVPSGFFRIVISAVVKHEGSAVVAGKRVRRQCLSDVDAQLGPKNGPRWVKEASRLQKLFKKPSAAGENIEKP